MNKGLWIARKNYLITLIKKVSKQNGGDDEEFLQTVIRETIESHEGEKIEKAIACYESLVR